MKFNQHYELEGRHSFLSPSQYHWVNYNDQKLNDVWHNLWAKQKGSEYHDLAARLIKLNVKLPRNHKTLNCYVNDAIGYRMTPEQPLYYSDNCFGTADAIFFDGKILRIHDLKTGKIPANMMQLRIYAAIFCLEYLVDPKTINFELRIYQNDEKFIEEPDYAVIEELMDKIVYFDKQITAFRILEE